MDVFDYADHFVHRLAATHDVARPVQIELHPGPHCDLYRCPHCYGHGQPPAPGKLLTPAEVGAALDAVAAGSPTVIVSGVTTEPLTHRQAAEIIAEVRRRNLPLGLYTKGRRLEGEVVDALLDGRGECFVTVSLDEVRADAYLTRHGLTATHREGRGGLSGADYFEQVLNNLRTFRRMRDAAGAAVEIRVAMLLFEDNCDPAETSAAARALLDVADRVRIAFPQDRNDGAPPGPLPPNAGERLATLKSAVADEPRIRVLETTTDPARSRVFTRCRVQRFQVVVDKSGNVFPCPQVAVGVHRRLLYGNIRKTGLREILASAERLRMFGLDVDHEMGCRICDRKDERLNVFLDRMNRHFSDG